MEHQRSFRHLLIQRYACELLGSPTIQQLRRRDGMLHSFAYEPMEAIMKVKHQLNALRVHFASKPLRNETNHAPGERLSCGPTLMLDSSKKHVTGAWKSHDIANKSNIREERQ